MSRTCAAALIQRAREIAKAHCGEIEARSDNKETVFSVRRPRRQEPLMMLAVQSEGN
jgi:hypothetical protein